MKNPDALMKIRCVNCRQQSTLDEMLQEESLFHPYERTVEGFLLCPNCGHRHHVYYLTEELRFKQAQLKELGEQWQETQEDSVYKEFKRLQTAYKKTYDYEQKHYAEVVEKEAERGRSTE